MTGGAVARAQLAMADAPNALEADTRHRRDFADDFRDRREPRQITGSDAKHFALLEEPDGRHRPGEPGRIAQVRSQHIDLHLQTLAPPWREDDAHRETLDRRAHGLWN